MRPPDIHRGYFSGQGGIHARPRRPDKFERNSFWRKKDLERLKSGIMASRVVPNRDVPVRQIAGFGHGGFPRDNDSGFANTVSFSPHHTFFNFRSLVDRPVAGTTDIARVLTLASVPFGIPLECAETAILERNRRIECREARCIFWASFNVELVVESFLTEIAFFVGNSIIEPAMRLNNEFRHIALPL